MITRETKPALLLCVLGALWIEWLLHSTSLAHHHCVVVLRVVPVSAHMQGKYEEGYGTVLDSGTTFTYLPSEAFAAFRDKVSAFATAKGLHSVKGPDPKFHDICFGGAPHVDHPDHLSSVFPSLELKFSQVALLPAAQVCCHFWL